MDWYFFSCHQRDFLQHQEGTGAEPRVDIIERESKLVVSVRFFPLDTGELWSLLISEKETEGVYLTGRREGDWVDRRNGLKGT